MKDFLWKVISVIWWGGILLFVGWSILEVFIPREPEKPPLVDTPKVEEYVHGDDKRKDLKDKKYIDPDYQYDKDNAFREEVEEDLRNERGGYSCNCSKTCDEIYTCEEAQYQLDVCGCYQRDGDDDGTACDLMCQY